MFCARRRCIGHRKGHGHGPRLLKGQADQGEANVKQGAEKLKDKANEVIGGLKDD